jgi:hypothetical protein
MNQKLNFNGNIPKIYIEETPPLDTYLSFCKKCMSQVRASQFRVNFFVIKIFDVVSEMNFQNEEQFLGNLHFDIRF